MHWEMHQEMHWEMRWEHTGYAAVFREVTCHVSTSAVHRQRWQKTRGIPHIANNKKAADTHLLGPAAIVV